VTTILFAAFGWLVPGGTYLLMRRYLQFAAFALVVSATFVAGLLLHGATAWPQPDELVGLDGFTALVFKGAGFAKMLAGAPYLAVQLFGVPSSFLSGRVHEYGTTLLIMSGAFNMLAVSSALDLKKEPSR